MNETVLEDFRKNWLNEIQNKKESSVQVYKEAMALERGEVMEALKMYRKAIRMDDNVERTMMNHPTIEPVEDDAEGPEFVPEIQIITNQEEQSKFMELPSEIAIQIFKWAVYFELPMVIELSAVSKQFQSLVKAAPIWKFMSSRAHQERDLSLCLPDFKSDWFSLWRDLPQLRQDGVYISKVSYIRPGYNAESYTQPLHLVTYFRYIRFLKNGRCMLVTSTSPPNEVVPQLSHFKGTIATHWIWTGPDEITMQWNDLKKHKLIFRAVFRINHTKRGFFNKLDWVTYCTYESDRPEESLYNFSSTHMRPFLFSRVKRYREIVIHRETIEQH